MKKIKKYTSIIFSVVLLTVIALLFLIITDSASPKGILVTQNKNDYIQLTITTDDRALSIFKDDIDRLFEDNPNIHVNLSYYPENTYYNMLNASLPSSSGPNIVAIDNPSVLGELISISRFLELRDFYNLTWRSSISGLSSDKSAYCTPPLGIKTYILFYNKKYFKDIGADTISEDFDQLLKMLDKLKREGYTPISFGARDYRCLKNAIVQLCFTEKDEDMWQNAESNFSRVKPYLATDMYLYDYEDALLQFKDGKAAAFFGVSTEFEELRKDCDFDVGTLYLHNADNNTIWFDYSGICAVNSNTQNKYYTLKVAQYLASDEAFDRYQEAFSEFVPKPVTNAKYRCNWFYDDEGAKLQRYMNSINKLQYGL